MIRRLALAALAAFVPTVVVVVPAPAFAQPSMPKKVKVKDIVQPMRIEKMEAPEEVRERFVEAIRQHDAKGIGADLRHRVLVRGMWFPDAACTKKFGKEKTVEKAEVGALAKCLAKLDLQIATSRRSPSPSREIITYAPGFEVEVTVDRGKVYYLSSMLPREKKPQPTVTALAFEALRTAGSTNVDAAVAAKLDREIVQRKHHVAAWLETCLDVTGKATTTVTEASTLAIGEVFLAATADWTFKPFLVGKTATPICTQTLLSYPSAKTPAVETAPQWSVPYPEEVDGAELGGVEGGVVGDGVEWIPGVGYSAMKSPPPPPPPPPAPPQNVPPTLLEGQRIAGDKIITPETTTRDEIVKTGKDKIIGSFKLCVDPQGAVMQVSMLKSTGFPAYDAKLIREMRLWAYRPYLVNGRAVPVCTAVTFIYSTK